MGKCSYSIARLRPSYCFDLCRCSTCQKVEKAIVDFWLCLTETEEYSGKKGALYCHVCGRAVTHSQ